MVKWCDCSKLVVCLAFLCFHSATSASVFSTSDSNTGFRFSGFVGLRIMHGVLCKVTFINYIIAFIVIQRDCTG